MIKIAIIGSRTFPNEALVRRLVQSLPRDWTVISGGARGPDSWAISEARALGMQCGEFPADWDTYGRQAGFIRNTAIAQSCDIVVAFMEALNPTNGTMDTIKKTAQLGKIVYIISDEAGLESCISHLV